MAHDSKVGAAKYGEKMIVVKVCFFTDELGAKEGRIKPKHGWINGFVRMQTNKSHGIKPVEQEPFNSLMEIPSVLEKVLIANDIKLHNARKMAKYIVT
jgi:hypothetical protein